ncbi:MAG: hypothetical protein HYR60_28415 [Acidobacteria bacterium]|nr:hypothetical protein [Acidobacteriota bacterium]
MFDSLLGRLFDCPHRRTSFPMTPRDPGDRRGTYVTCLECGKEFAYNWKKMRIEAPLDPPGPVIVMPATRPIRSSPRAA